MPVEQSGDDGNKKATVLSQRQRHRSWLTRERGGARHKDAWRPRKRCRISAEKWIVALDNQVRVCTGFGGLSFIKPDWDADIWQPQNWRQWPHASGNLDQGGDGLSGFHALMFKDSLRLCMTPWYDWTHGAQRDTHVAFKATGQYSTMLLFLMIFNLAQGPDKEEGMRFQQLQECLQHMVEIHGSDPAGFDLLCARSNAMIHELQEEIGGEHDSPLEALWEYISSNAPFVKKGYRVKNCEFGAWVSAAEAFLSQWTLTLFKCEYCCLELDMLHGKNFAQKIVVDKQHVKEATEADSTSMTHTQIDQKILKSCCQNILVCAVAVLSEHQFQRTLAIMALSCSPLRHWQGKASKDMKSAEMNIDWLKLQFKSGFTELIVQTFHTLADGNLLRKAGFFALESVEECDREFHAMLDDEFANLQGNLVVQLISARLNRLLYILRGWPHQFVQLQLGARLAQLVLKHFRQDYLAWLKVSSGAEYEQCRKIPSVQAALARSLFGLTAVKMFLEACRETRFCTHPDLEKLSCDIIGGTLSTLVVEDTNNVQKNSKQCKGSMKFRKPERAFAVAIASQVLEGRHKYHAVAATNQVSSCSFVLPSSAFGKPPPTKKDMPQPTVSVDGVATYQQKASYFSPVAAGVGTPAADQAVFRELHAFPEFRAVAGQSYMGGFAGPGRSFVFRRASKIGTSFGWHLGMGHFTKSGFIAWPIELKSVPGHASVFVIEPATDVEVVPVFAVFDWLGMDGVIFTWRSWAWQCINVPRALKSWQPATRMVTDGKVQPLIDVAAKMAFWSMDMPMVKDVCKITKQLEFPSSCSNLLDVLVFAVMKVLGVTEFDALSVVRQRMVKTKVKDDEATQALLESDEATKVLEPQDEELVKKEKVKLKSAVEADAEFEGQWRSKRETARSKLPGSAKAKAQKSSKGSSSSSASKTGPSVLPLSMDMMDQNKVKTYMPSTGFIWKARGAGCWNSKVPPFGACSRSISKHGENEALRLVIASAWHDYCLNEGIPFQSCPMGGLPDLG